MNKHYFTLNGGYEKGEELFTNQNGEVIGELYNYNSFFEMKLGQFIEANKYKDFQIKQEEFNKTTIKENKSLELSRKVFRILSNTDYFQYIVKELLEFEPRKLSKNAGRYIDEDWAYRILDSYLKKSEIIYGVDYTEKNSKDLILYLQKCIQTDKNYEISADYLYKNFTQILIGKEKIIDTNTLYLLVPKENIKEKMLLNDYKIPHILKFIGEELKIEKGNEHNFRVYLGDNYESISYGIDMNGNVIEAYNSDNLGRDYYETDDLFY